MGCCWGHKAHAGLCLFTQVQRCSLEDYILSELNWFLSFCLFKVLQRYVVSNALTHLGHVVATQATLSFKAIFPTP